MLSLSLIFVGKLHWLSSSIGWYAWRISLTAVCVACASVDVFGVVALLLCVRVRFSRKLNWYDFTLGSITKRPGRKDVRASISRCYTELHCQRSMASSKLAFATCLSRKK